MKEKTKVKNKFKARVIALYLPQFHPVVENDIWWGKGFTEWTNVGKAKPLFKNHYQPRVPADLGYYDLRLSEVRETQAELARNAGIEGFMYWHYWFGNGKKLLERPFSEVLESGKPDFPFCLGWANHSWENKTWDSREQHKVLKTLIKQEYLGEKDYIDHFNHVLKAFKDPRYITIDDKPIFYLYAPLSFPDVTNFMHIWQTLALQNGLKGVYFIGQTTRNPDCEKILNIGFDGVCRQGIIDISDKIKDRFLKKWIIKIGRRINYSPLNIVKYTYLVDNFITPNLDTKENIFPSIVPNFDHSPRSGRNGLIYHGSTPALFQKLLNKVIKTISSKKDDHKIIFLRSWNEWAEGNYVEPDLVHGHGYLDALRDEIIESK